jgi:hypothetical protein
LTIVRAAEATPRANRASDRQGLQILALLVTQIGSGTKTLCGRLE